MPLPERAGVNRASIAAEQEEESVLLKERTFDGLPAGFQTNFSNDERLESLSQTFAGGVADSLNNTVMSISEPTGRKFDEADVIDHVLDRVQTGWDTETRTISLPGIALNRKLIKAAAVAFKEDSDTPSGKIKPPWLATNDDIVFEFVTPESYNQITSSTDVSNDDYRRTGLADDADHNIIGSNGHGGGGGTLSLNAADWVFYTGDVVDPLNDAIFSKFQWKDVDGDGNYGPVPAYPGRLFGSLHHQLITAHLIKDTVQLNGKIYFAGTTNVAQPIPIAFRLTDGANVQALQD